MYLAATFLWVWAIVHWSRGTPFGTWLHLHMVERPAAWLNRLDRRNLGTAAVLASLTAALVWIGGDDATRMIGMAAPDVAAWLATVELSTVVEALVAATTAISLVWRCGGEFSKRGPISVATRRLGKRSRARGRRQRPSVPANDEGDLRRRRAAA